MDKNILLMDKISAVLRRPELLQQINKVRLRLKVARLSDITTEDGQCIHEWAFYGPPKVFSTEPKICFPHGWVRECVCQHSNGSILHPYFLICYCNIICVIGPF